MNFYTRPSISKGTDFLQQLANEQSELMQQYNPALTRHQNPYTNKNTHVPFRILCDRKSTLLGSYKESGQTLDLGSKGGLEFQLHISSFIYTQVIMRVCYKRLTKRTGNRLERGTPQMPQVKGSGGSVFNEHLTTGKSISSTHVFLWIFYEQIENIIFRKNGQS